MTNNILIYGGSFDPLHLGHLNTAIAIQKYFRFDRFIFLPCKTPVLKKATTASSDQRVHMLQLALEPYPKFEIDLREIKRETPSYMVDTLQSFRDELGDQVSITLLLGMDAFLQLPHWHNWQKLLELSNLLVMKRAAINRKTMAVPLKTPGSVDNSSLHYRRPAACPRDVGSVEMNCQQTLLKAHEIFDKNELLKQSCGKIYQYNAGEYAISSSDLREKIGQGENVQNYLPEDVYRYIKKQKLYM